MKTKILLLLFISLMLLLSCQTGKNGKGGVSDNADTSQNTENGEELTENANDGPKPNLPEGADYGGYEFKVLTRGDEMHAYPAHTRDIMAEAETGEPLNDAVYKRNSIVEELLNIKITMIVMAESDESRPNNAVKNAFNAGDDIYDLFTTHMVLGGATAQSGYLKNWGIMPYVDFSQPWWCKSATENLSVGNKIMLALSDFSISANDNAYICLFNKQIQKEWEVEDLYEVVKSGKWTFDKMHSIVKDIKKDLNGDGQMDENDLYGLVIAADAGTLNFFYAGGNTVTAKDLDNVPYLGILTERSAKTFEKTFDICTADFTYYLTQWNREKFTGMFQNNRAFIQTAIIDMVPEFRGMDVDFGIIPYPKLDDLQDKYMGFVDGHAQLMGIPAMVREEDKVGAIVEALSYYSYQYVVPAYYEINLKTKFTRDDESAEMLDIIMDGRVFDFGYVYDNWIIAFQFQELIRSKKDSFVSTMEKNMPKAQKNLEAVLAAYEAIN
jgi:hypothetical protein